MGLTDWEQPAPAIITDMVKRWAIEVTFEESRDHLGVDETQRQWNDLAIERTTPALFGLFSLVALLGHALYQTAPYRYRRVPGIIKPRPALAMSWP